MSEYQGAGADFIAAVKKRVDALKEADLIAPDWDAHQMTAGHVKGLREAAGMFRECLAKYVDYDDDDERKDA